MFWYRFLQRSFYSLLQSFTLHRAQPAVFTQGTVSREVLRGFPSSKPSTLILKPKSATPVMIQAAGLQARCRRWMRMTRSASS